MPAGKQLLIVEDDANSREGYRIYLSGAGFDVHTLPGGAHALDFVRSASPDLVVLDLGLPDLDGWEVARRLKSDEQTKRIPIIAFSGLLQAARAGERAPRRLRYVPDEAVSSRSPLDRYQETPGNDHALFRSARRAARPVLILSVFVFLRAASGKQTTGW